MSYNDIPVKITSHPYVLVNRGILCNCSTEVENNFLLESLAACHDMDSKLVIYFTVNTAFVNYLESFDNLTDSLKSQIILNRTTYEQTLPFSLKLPDFDSELIKAPKTLKDYIHQFEHKKRIFDLQERHTNMELELPNKIFFFNNYIVDIFFLFATAIISMMVTIIVMHILYKHMKHKTLLTSLALQQIKEICVVATQECVTLAHDIKCTSKIQWYIHYFDLKVINFGYSAFCHLTSRKLKLFRVHLFSHAAKIILFISGAQYYALIRWCRMARSIHLFKITRMLTHENVKFK